MRRTTLLITIVALLASVPATVSADSVTKRILKDCVDGQIDGKYSNADLARARKEIPAEAQEYSDCEGAIYQARIANSSSANGSGGGGSSGSGSSSGSSSSGSSGGPGGGGGAAGSSSTPSGGSGSSDDATAPASGSESSDAQGAAEQAALRAAQRGGGAVRLGPDTLVKPGATGIPASEALRRAVPDPLLVALILLGAIALVGVVLGARARVITRRPG
jgi:hypothetical protein